MWQCVCPDLIMSELLVYKSSTLKFKSDPFLFSQNDWLGVSKYPQQDFVLIQTIILNWNSDAPCFMVALHWDSVYTLSQQAYQPNKEIGKRIYFSLIWLFIAVEFALDTPSFTSLDHLVASLAVCIVQIQSFGVSFVVENKGWLCTMAETPGRWHL